jgi:F420-non-reducing hydrogenase iron-sulfur subunit
MCTGRVEPSFILQAFLNGADGVFIGGCWPGECHYSTEGNYHALSMVHLTRRILQHIGVNPQRLRLEWVSASQGIRFAEVMNDVSKTIRELGPLGTSEGIEGNGLKHKLEAVNDLLPYIKLVERERLRVRFKTEEEYTAFFASEEFDRIFRELIADKLTVTQIMSLLSERPLSTGEISKVLGLSPSEVSKHVNNSARQGLVRFDESQRRFVPVLCERA